MTFLTHKEKSDFYATYDDTPTMTDQSQADDTDINVIVKRYGIHGQVPGHNMQPSYEDWTNFPEDLKGFIEQARSIDRLHDSLPHALRDMTFEELSTLTNDEISHIIADSIKVRREPAPTPAPAKGETK